MARLRKAIGASPKELANMIPLSSHLIYRYEAGNYGSHPRADKAKKIADFFGVSLNWLLSPEDDTDKPLPVDPESLKEIKFPEGNQIKILSAKGIGKFVYQ